MSPVIAYGSPFPTKIPDYPDWRELYYPEVIVEKTDPDSDARLLVKARAVLECLQAAAKAGATPQVLDAIAGIMP